MLVIEVAKCALTTDWQRHKRSCSLAELQGFDVLKSITEMDISILLCDFLFACSSKCDVCVEALDL